MHLQVIIVVEPSGERTSEVVSVTERRERRTMPPQGAEGAGASGGFVDEGQEGGTARGQEAGW